MINDAAGAPRQRDRLDPDGGADRRGRGEAPRPHPPRAGRQQRDHRDGRRRSEPRPPRDPLRRGRDGRTALHVDPADLHAEGDRGCPDDASSSRPTRRSRSATRSSRLGPDGTPGRRRGGRNDDEGAGGGPRAGGGSDPRREEARSPRLLRRADDRPRAPPEWRSFARRPSPRSST